MASAEGPRDCGATTTRRIGAIASAAYGGLAAQYVVGYIHVDFGKQTVILTEANLRDDYDERVDVVTPPAKWWAAARVLLWPIAQG
jgi:hypothetical protein